MGTSGLMRNVHIADFSSYRHPGLFFRAPFPVQRLGQILEYGTLNAITVFLRQ
jgi:hypothetical protein